jgi:hypothetical protein
MQIIIHQCITEDNMTLREKQSEFAALVPMLIWDAIRLGYEVTLGEAWRSKEEAERLAKLGKGIKGSLHTIRLAIDINLFKNGKYLTKTEDYAELGKLWESRSTAQYECHWGGRFGDGNHFSIGHGGKK